MNKGTPRRKNLIGMKFGKLTVIDKAEDDIRPNRRVYVQWKCQCDCGSEPIIVPARYLTSGSRTHCGCVSSYEDLTGQKFGHLTVVRVAEKEERTTKKCVQWWCKCDCGNSKLVLVLASNLKKGNTTSCGCVHSKITSERGKEVNHYDLSGEYGIGWDYNAREFYFDLEDYDKIKDYCWYIDDKGYVKSSIIQERQVKRIKLHRIIMDVTDSKIMVDHIHGQETRNDNRKSNLRLGSNAENSRNKGLLPTNTSGVTGVGWHKAAQKWRAYIRIDGQDIHLGLFENKEDAIAARKTAEEKYFGEWSYDNSQAM